MLVGRARETNVSIRQTPNRDIRAIPKYGGDGWNRTTKPITGYGFTDREAHHTAQRPRINL